MTSLLRVLFLILAFASAPTLSNAQDLRVNGAKLKDVIAAIDADDWPKAARISAGINDDAARLYFEWRRLRGGLGEWPEYADFIRDHADWPGLPLLSRVGEGKIPTQWPATEITDYFRANPPQTGIGGLRLVQALETLKRVADAREVLVETWTRLPMSSTTRSQMLARYGSVLAEHHWKRADHMIWTGQLDQAQAMLPLLTNGQKRLVEARIALRKGRNGVNKMIDAIPTSLKKDPGLAFDRFRWRMRRDQYNGARDLIIATSGSSAQLGRPEIWAARRSSLARYYMRAESYKTAYQIASNHRLGNQNSGYTDLEWLSGYLALEYLGRPNDAIEHFRNTRTVAVTPITQGRIWYWLGKAHQKAGNAEKAQEAWDIASKFQTSFYGQLATEAGKLPAQSVLPGAQVHNWRESDFMGSTVFRAGFLLHYAKERYESGRFFAHQAETLTLNQQEKLGQLLLELDRPNMALRVAKNGAAMGRIVMPAYYPVTKAVSSTQTVPPEFALAIVRQETEFNPDVESPAGARGLMQLMPNTARGVSKKLGLSYSADRLISDPAYNVKLGTAYLKEMLDRYRGSYVLAAAAYNAGPSRVDQWIKQYGDPRKSSISTVRWIEKIPFNETRNYVMRVMESVGVYRARLSGDASAVDISKDLARGG